MNEFNEQEFFFIDILDKNKSKNKGLNLYKDLVYNRFYEVISGANPILIKLINKKELEFLIFQFMKNGSKTEFIWEVPKEFKNFLKNIEDIKIKYPFIVDLMWFEWIEISMIMKNYNNFQYDSLDLNQKYKLSESTKIKKLSFKVYENEFDKKGLYPILVYYDFKKSQVIYREISIFMYKFLKNISKISINETITILSEKYSINEDELKNLLCEALIELCSLGILKIKG